jgi:hypothetical protein
MRIDYPLQLPKEDARARLHVLGEYLHNRHGLRIRWSGDTATFEGKYLVVRIEGELALGDDMVTFRGKDPGALWRKKATGYLQGKLETYLDPATPIDELPRNK